MNFGNLTWQGVAVVALLIAAVIAARVLFGADAATIAGVLGTMAAWLKQSPRTPDLPK